MKNIYLELYDNYKIYVSPSGDIMNAEKIYANFPAAQQFTYIVHTDEGSEMMYGFYMLSAMKSKYHIDSSLNDEEACQAIEDAMNAEREAQEEEARAASEIITPEERIAAALEFQTLNSLPDIV